MIVISEQDYSDLKEQIKKELIEEQRAKPESFNTICQREQSAIFNRMFPESMPIKDPSRRWKLRQVISAMTNICRQRSELRIKERVCPVNNRGAAVHSEMELDSAIQTFEAICLAAREAYREDVTPDAERDEKYV